MILLIIIISDTLARPRSGKETVSIYLAFTKRFVNILTYPSILFFFNYLGCYRTACTFENCNIGSNEVETGDDKVKGLSIIIPASSFPIIIIKTPRNLTT